MLNVDPNNVDALCDRAEAYIADEKLDEGTIDNKYFQVWLADGLKLSSALQDYQKATNIDENSQRAKEGVNKVQKLQKQASKKDYYKILGVKRHDCRFRLS